MCRNLVIGLIIFTPLWVNEIWQDNFDTSCLLNYPKNVFEACFMISYRSDIPSYEGALF